MSPPAPGTITVRSETATWRLVLPADPTTDAQRHLARYGTAHEPALVRALGLLLGPDDLLVDLGADVGDRSVPLAVRPGCRVVAVESRPAALAALRATAGLEELGGRLEVRERLDADDPLPGPVTAVVIGAVAGGPDPAEVLRGLEAVVGRDRPELHVACADLAALDAVAAWAHRAGYAYAATHAVPDRPAPPVHHLRPLGADEQDGAWLPARASYAGEATPDASRPGGPPPATGTRDPVAGASGERQLPPEVFPRGRPGVRLVAAGGVSELTSEIGPDAHRTLWSTDAVPVAAWGAGPVSLALEVEPTGETTAVLSLVVRFVDADGEVVAATRIAAGAGRHTDPPPEAVAVRVGLRVDGPGAARVRVLTSPTTFREPPVPTGRRVLLVSEAYPTAADPYANAYVHARVRGYRDRGLEVDVFRLAPDLVPGTHEHEGVAVSTGDAADLRGVLDTGGHRTVVVHRLDAEIWRAVRDRLTGRRLLVWVHGYELQRWQRRAFAHEDAVGLERARMRGEARDRMWPEVVAAAHHHDLHLVFVSHHSAAEARADYDLDLPDGRVHVVPNPIDTSVFSHSPKPPGQRLRILSVRSWRNSIYAGDLAVAAVLDLAREPWFDELDIRFVGDGPLFEPTLAPLRAFDNVTLHRGWLTHQGLADLYTAYGVGLMPTRMDSHGVSRDEMMAAGMVPLTTATAAVPEYVDDGVEGFLAPYDDWRALADAVRRLRAEPETFTRMSLAAAARVRRRSATDVVVPAELRLLQP